MLTNIKKYARKLYKIMYINFQIINFNFKLYFKNLKINIKHLKLKDYVYYQKTKNVTFFLM